MPSGDFCKCKGGFISIDVSTILKHLVASQLHGFKNEVLEYKSKPKHFDPSSNT